MLFVAEPADKYQRQPAGARLHKSDLRVNAAGDHEYVFELDTQVDAFLMDHAFDGVPVLPMAYALELMCEAACSTYPNLSLKLIESFDIPAGILFDSQRKKLSIIVHEEKGDRSKWLLSSQSYPASLVAVKTLEHAFSWERLFLCQCYQMAYRQN